MRIVKIEKREANNDEMYNVNRKREFYDSLEMNTIQF